MYHDHAGDDGACRGATESTSSSAESRAAARPDTPAGVGAVLTIIQSVPAEVAQQGAKATEKWINENYGSRRAFMAYIDLAKCAAGLAVAIGSNLIVFSKVLKIKSAINALGGVAKIMQQIADRTNRGEDFLKALSEVFDGAGAGLGAIAVEILSVQPIIDNCF